MPDAPLIRHVFLGDGTDHVVHRAGAPRVGATRVVVVDAAGTPPAGAVTAERPATSWAATADVAIGVLGPGVVPADAAPEALACHLLVVAPSTAIAVDRESPLFALLISKAAAGADPAAAVADGYLHADWLARANLTAGVAEAPTEAALELAELLSGHAPLAVTATLRIAGLAAVTLRESLALEAESQMECLVSPEHTRLLAAGILRPARG